MREERPQRVYVKLLCEISPRGQVKPLSLTLPDGRHYHIERVVVEERATPHTPGPASATRYEVIVRHQLRPLWQETGTGRWFVEMPAPY